MSHNSFYAFLLSHLPGMLLVILLAIIGVGLFAYFTKQKSN